MLTRKQHELLSFIDGHIRATGFSPSFEEMKTALDLKSKSGIHRLISALEERGFLRRHHHRARALEITKMPNDGAVSASFAMQVAMPAAMPVGRTALATAPSPFEPNVIRGNFSGRFAGVRSAQDVGAIELPMYGRIAAGAPIEALRDNGTTIEVPMALLGSGDHYALEVAGDSMIEAGILDGDTVVIRKTETAETGQIVVAFIDNTEVTLKRLRKRGQSVVALEPANALYEAQIFPANRVRVQGRLVALLRRYDA